MKNIRFIVLLLFISCYFNNNYAINKKYYIDNESIEDIIILTDKKYIRILECEIKGEINNEIILYYSHYPFKYYNYIILNGKINNKFRTDWYDNQCKIRLEIKSKDTKGLIELKLKFI
jgi:hypothetical protein